MSAEERLQGRVTEARAVELDDAWCGADPTASQESAFDAQAVTGRLKYPSVVLKQG